MPANLKTPWGFSIWSYQEWSYQYIINWSTARNDNIISVWLPCNSSWLESMEKHYVKQIKLCAHARFIDRKASARTLSSCHMTKECFARVFDVKIGPTHIKQFYIATRTTISMTTWMKHRLHVLPICSEFFASMWANEIFIRNICFTL